MMHYVSTVYLPMHLKEHFIIYKNCPKIKLQFSLRSTQHTPHTDRCGIKQPIEVLLMPNPTSAHTLCVC